MFVNRAKLKVLALGNQIMLHRLVAQVDENEVAVTGCSETAEVTERLSKEHYDMIIVDHLVKDAEQVCRDVINGIHVPVAVVMQEKLADWKALRKLEVDGYLPDDKGSDELMARIRAYSRRYAAVEQVLE
jgi:DNA-binding response OmpR family regulator